MADLKNQDCFQFLLLYLYWGCNVSHCMRKDATTTSWNKAKMAECSFQGIKLQDRILEQSNTSKWMSHIIIMLDIVKMDDVLTFARDFSCNKRILQARRGLIVVSTEVGQA